MIIADLESDGLLPELTKIHCAVLYNTETDRFMEFTPENIDNLPQMLDKCPQLSFHNGVCFDIPAIEKVSQKPFTKVIFDTLIASRILFPDKQGKNPHSVQSYGKEFGIQKPEHEDWSQYSEDMLHRCKEDVKIQSEIYKLIIREIQRYSVLDSRITNESFLKILHMEQKVAQIIEQQARNGWQLDLQKCYELVDWLTPQIEEVEAKLVPNLPITVVRVADKETKAFTASGQITAIAQRWLGDDSDKLCGDFCKVRFDKFNIGSSDQVKNYLLSKGWQPTEYNFKKDNHNKPLRDAQGKQIKTSPKTPSTPEEWQEIADLLDDENIKLLAHYNKMTHRRSQIQGFIRNCRASDHRIEAQATACSSNTARMVHRIVVNVPKAKPDVYLGTEMRSLFIAAPGKVLVGCDADALEARNIAGYLYDYDPVAALELIEGDLHQINADKYGITRDKAKGVFYALLYGCGVAKLGKMLGCNYQQAKILYDQFWLDYPGVKQFRDDVEAEYDKYGYILSIDGRPLTVRYRHALVNTKVQSAGSITMKLALCIADKWIKAENLDHKFVGNFHDEFDSETSPQDAQRVGEIKEKAMLKAGELLGIKIPITGKAKIGSNWAEIH